jgi:hypothetical protein
MTWWTWPLPAEGVLHLRLDCPTLELSGTGTLELGDVKKAAAGARTLRRLGLLLESRSTFPPSVSLASVARPVGEVACGNAPIAVHDSADARNAAHGRQFPGPAPGLGQLANLSAKALTSGAGWAGCKPQVLAERPSGAAASSARSSPRRSTSARGRGRKPSCREMS